MQALRAAAGRVCAGPSVTRIGRTASVPSGSASVRGFAEKVDKKSLSAALLMNLRPPSAHPSAVLENHFGSAADAFRAHVATTAAIRPQEHKDAHKDAAHGGKRAASHDEPLSYSEDPVRPFPPHEPDPDLKKPPRYVSYADSVVGPEPFDGFHIRRELMQRFQARKERKEIIKDIKSRPMPTPERLINPKKIDAQGRAFGLGRRKEAVAQAWILPGEGWCTVNGVNHAEYFDDPMDRAQYYSAFEATGTHLKFDVQARITGGGTRAQGEALRLAVARALQSYDPDNRLPLRQAGLLTRDPRMVERKHVGRKKARRAFQWVKR